jgi:hypothetical protein
MRISRIYRVGSPRSPNTDPGSGVTGSFRLVEYLRWRSLWNDKSVNWLLSSARMPLAGMDPYVCSRRAQPEYHRRLQQPMPTLRLDQVRRPDPGQSRPQNTSDTKHYWVMVRMHERNWADEGDVLYVRPSLAGPPRRIPANHVPRYRLPPLRCLPYRRLPAGLARDPQRQGKLGWLGSPAGAVGGRRTYPFSRPDGRPRCNRSVRPTRRQDQAGAHMLGARLP